MKQEEPKEKVRERDLKVLFGIIRFNSKQSNKHDRIAVCMISYLCWEEKFSRDSSDCKDRKDCNSHSVSRQNPII